MQPVQKFYSISEAAQILGVSAETLRRWERSGKIKVGRTPTGNRIFSQDILDSLKNSFNQPQKSQNKVAIKVQKTPKSSDSQAIQELEQPYTTLHNPVSFPKFSSKPSYKTGMFGLMAIITLLSISLSLYTLFSYSPLPKVLAAKTEVAKGQAVLGVETFVIPVIVQGEVLIQNFAVRASDSISKLVQNFALKANDAVSKIASLIKAVKSSPLAVALFGSDENRDIVERVVHSLPPGIKIDGDNIILGSSSGGTTTVNNNLEVLGSSSFSDVNIRGSLNVEGPTTFSSLSINTITTTSSTSIGGDLTITGTVNGNTFTNNSLVFSGSSPSISASTANSTISLNAGTTGAINIGNASTGDIHIGGGSASSGCSVTNDDGSFNCSGNITSNADLIANGGDILTNQTTFNLLTQTVTTLNIGSSQSTINLQGTASFTKAPTLAHTGTWAINSSTWNQSNATVYINPATATADSNLLGIAVNGGVKFAVDAEGDIYGNNLVVAGNTTTATTTVSGDLTVEGNTTLGDATSDTLTINPATLTWAGGNKTLDIAGAGTRTLTLLNSTASQVADIDLSDGNLKVNGTTIITNAGAGSFTTVGGTISTASQTNITAVGTLTSLTVTGNINSSSGGLQTNGVTRVDNSGNVTGGTGSFGGSINPSLDATYDLGTAVLRWNNAYFAGDVTAGDLVFKNNFRFTEDADKGIFILNPKGEKIGGFDDEGNLWMKGEIRQWATK